MYASVHNDSQKIAKNLFRSEQTDSVPDMFRSRTRHPVFCPDQPSDPIFMGVFLVIIGVIQFHVFMGKYSLIGGITYIGGNSPNGGIRRK